MICRPYLRGLLLLCCLSAPAFAQGSCEPISDDIHFSPADGIVLHGEVLSPCGSNPSQKLPTVMFVNAFGQSYMIYRELAVRFAQEGFRTLSYDPRGWQSSGGQTTFDYTLLTADARKAIDWLTAHYATGRIGSTGISEGGGLSLLLSAEDPRLSAVASLSGWTDLTHASLGGTPRLAWHAILGTMLILFGDPTAVIEDAIRQAQDKGPQVDPRIQARKISAWYHLPAINAKKVPVLLAHEMDDTLFPVNQVFDFYRHLEGPKHLIIERGFHAATEIVHLHDPDGMPWPVLRQWFTDYLKDGTPSKLDGRVSIAFKNQDKTLELENNAWKVPNVKTFYMAQTDHGYDLRDAATLSLSGDGTKVLNLASDPSGVTTGVPLLSALANLQSLATVEVPVKSIVRPFAISYVSSVFAQDTTVYGTPVVRLRLHSEAAKGLVIAHLVDVGPDGDGQLITHGTYTWNREDAPRDQAIALTIELYTVAWKLAKGHSLAVVLNSEDAEYQGPTLLPYVYELDHDAGVNTLEVPLLAD